MQLPSEPVICSPLFVPHTKPQVTSSKTFYNNVICCLLEVGGVFHLPKNSGNSGWDVNGTRLFGSCHWKISGKSGTSSEKVVPFSQGKVPNGNLCSIYRISRLYHQFHAFRGLFKRPGFPELPRVSKKWRLIRVRFLEAFCKQT